MNDAFPRCAVPGSSCRLLQLEAGGARPVWAVLDAAGIRRFTGEVTLAVTPAVRAYFSNGELYFAEREGDASIGDRLVEYGVASADDLAAGTVQLGAIAHLGRLFDRVPELDRDRVELALEVITGEVLGEIADHTVDEVTIASYRHHPSGVVKWLTKPTIVVTQAPRPDEGAAPSTGEVPVVVAGAAANEAPADIAEPEAAPEFTPTAADEALVADYEAMIASLADTATTSWEPPTEQLEVPESLRILEEPVRLTPHEDTITDTTASSVTSAEDTTADAAEATTDVELGDGRDDQPATDFDDEIDLDRVIEEVQLEADGEALPVDGTYLFGDDVRDAVRQALAEIEAATRPLITEGLSAAALAAALDDTPETGPWLPEPRHRHGLHSSTPSTAPVAATPAEDDKPKTEAQGGGLRRLIGGSRKP